MTDGICKPGFERVAEAFKKNFDKNGEIGASVCLTVGGETVVDLWDGVADPKTGAQAGWMQAIFHSSFASRANTTTSLKSPDLLRQAPASSATSAAHATTACTTP